MHAKLEIPDSWDEATKGMILGLLERDSNKRLADAAVIKSHAYFKGIDWDKILRKEVVPPFIPPVKGKLDVSMVDPAFTSEKPTINDESDPTDNKISADNQKKFEGFNYIPESELKR